MGQYHIVLSELLIRILKEITTKCLLLRWLQKKFDGISSGRNKPVAESNGRSVKFPLLKAEAELTFLGPERELLTRSGLGGPGRPRAHSFYAEKPACALTCSNFDTHNGCSATNILVRSETSGSSLRDPAGTIICDPSPLDQGTPEPQNWQNDLEISRPGT